MQSVSVPSLLATILGIVTISTLLWLYQNLPLVLVHDGKLGAFLVTVCAMTGVILFAFIGFVVRETFSDRSDDARSHSPPVPTPQSVKNPSKIS